MQINEVHDGNAIFVCHRQMQMNFQDKSGEADEY